MIPVNTQPIEKSVYLPDGELDVVSVWRTLQGEGPHAGTPAVFVRLAGCNLVCKYCDTDYTNSRKLVSVRDLVSRVEGLDPDRVYTLVVITGGEPFRQNITPFVQALLDKLWRVQIETNGTLYDDSMPYMDDHLDIVCSPKTPRISPELERHVTAFKYILQEGQIEQEDGLPLTTMGMAATVARPPLSFPRERIFVQPLDEGDDSKNAANANACVRSCLRFGYRLSLQIHKTLGLE